MSDPKIVELPLQVKVELPPEGFTPADRELLRQTASELEAIKRYLQSMTRVTLVEAR